MTKTDTSTAQIVQTYYAILTGGMAAYDPAQLRAILATDLVFEGPIAGHVVGAERFSNGVSGFIETMRSLTMVDQLCAGDTAATLYDAEMPAAPSASPSSSTLRTARSKPSSFSTMRPSIALGVAAEAAPSDP
jgi:hypothetical protein